MNDLTDDTKAIILLCGVLGGSEPNGLHAIKPLSIAQYNAIVRWLLSEKMRPADLLSDDKSTVAANATGIAAEHLKALLARGVELALTVEGWQRNGIWIISRSDPDYPTRYKKHLKEQAPPLLYGVGDRSLLLSLQDNGGVAIVGSRNVDNDGAVFSQATAALCAANAMTVISGGARGVDQTAMDSALATEGKVIGILAEELLKKSLERNARQAIAQGQLLLLSPCHPKARFTVATAMSRNKLIYAMADYSLVVSAEYNKGGTWAGAAEELKRNNALPVFVRTGNKVPAGNGKLLALGAMAWPELNSEAPLTQQLARQLAKQATRQPVRTQQANLNLFDLPQQPVTATTAGVIRHPKYAPDTPAHAIYQAVLPVIIKQLSPDTTIDELAKKLDVSKTQLNCWLSQAVDEGKIQQLSESSKYQKVMASDAIKDSGTAALNKMTG